MIFFWDNLAQASHQPFPILSPTWDILTKPRRKPSTLRDCKPATSVERKVLETLGTGQLPSPWPGKKWIWMRTTERSKADKGGNQPNAVKFWSDWVTCSLARDYSSREKVFVDLLPVAAWKIKRLAPSSTRQALVCSIGCRTSPLREAWRQNACPWGCHDGRLQLQQRISLCPKTGCLLWQFPCYCRGILAW